jgi:pyruvate dehydrogenase phosphatase
MDSFLAIDKDIIEGPQHLLDPRPAHDMLGSILPSPTPAETMVAKVERTGACALTAMIDVQRDELFIVNAGDCRAVAGWWVPEDGKWRVDILSEDQMGDNPAEQERCVASRRARL